MRRSQTAATNAQANSRAETTPRGLFTYSNSEKLVVTNAVPDINAMSVMPVIRAMIVGRSVIRAPVVTAVIRIAVPVAIAIRIVGGIRIRVAETEPNRKADADSEREAPVCLSL